MAAIRTQVQMNEPASKGKVSRAVREVYKRQEERGAPTIYITEE
jgi:hypothetical protein